MSTCYFHTAFNHQKSFWLHSVRGREVLGPEVRLVEPYPSVLSEGGICRENIPLVQEHPSQLQSCCHR